MLKESIVEAMLRESFAVANDDKFHTGASDGNIHSPQVAKETNLPLVVVADHADNNHVAFLSLKSINGMDAHLLSYSAVKTLHLEKTPYFYLMR